MSKKGQPWGHEEEKEMLDRLRRGHTFDRVAQEHERTVKAIQWRWGLYCKRRIRDRGDLEKLAHEFHVDPLVLQDILSQLDSSSHQKSPATTATATDDTRIHELLLKILRNQKKILARLPSQV